MKKNELAEKTKQELVAIARQVGLAGRSKMNKEDLVLSLAALFRERNREALKKTGTTKLASTRSSAVSRALVEKKAGLPVRQKVKKEIIKVINTAIPAAAGKAETWQEKVEDTKFYLGAEERAFITEQELPAGYGDNSIILMARDPHWVYVYWEINSARIDEARKSLKSAFDQSSLILRVYDITSIDFNGTNAHSCFDIEIPNVLGNWYVNLGSPNMTFCIDIGYRIPDGGLFVLSRSNNITSPRGNFSEVSDEEWMSSEEEYKKIYAKSAGVGQTGSSSQLAEALKKHLENETSSGGVRGVEPEKSSRNH